MATILGAENRKFHTRIFDWEIKTETVWEIHEARDSDAILFFIVLKFCGGSQLLLYFIAVTSKWLVCFIHNTLPIYVELAINESLFPSFIICLAKDMEVAENRPDILGWGDCSNYSSSNLDHITSSNKEKKVWNLLLHTPSIRRLPGVLLVPCWRPALLLGFLWDFSLWPW